MSDRAPKRKRAESAITATAVRAGSTASKFNCATAVAKLPEKVVRDLVLIAARTNPGFVDVIKAEVDRLAAERGAQVIDFDHYSKSVWKTINAEYRKLSPSHRYDRAGDAVKVIEECIEAIAKECPEDASFETKKNALETCRKIGKTVCISNSVIGDEVRKNFKYVPGVVTTMWPIADSLTAEERRRIIDGEFGEKLLELENLAIKYLIFEGLDCLRMYMRGK